MQPRLTRAEYWLLETSVLAGTPLCWLCAENYSGEFPDDIECQFNKTSHGLTRDELIQTFSGMFRQGWIQARRADRIVALDGSGILQALEENGLPDDRTFYSLTSRGGAVWEAFAAPNWEWYIDEVFDPTLMTGMLTCMTEWRLRHYLENYRLMGYEVDPASVCFSVISEWEATDWKRLSHGFRAEFCCKGEIDPQQIDQLAFAGLCDFRDGWYHWQ